tara:strand:+ start:179 stop:775 length:597 start_codon:yes stop_codon:yes gene_type:complete
MIMLGLQTGSEKLRTTILHRYETNFQAKYIGRICNEIGLKFSIDHIFDIPFDTPDNLLESLKIYNEIRPSMINTYRLLYLPSTDIVEIAKRAGLITNTMYCKILEGKYSETIKAPYERNYHKFHIMYTILPLLPKKVMFTFINNPKLLLITIMIPFQVQQIIKTILYVRIGSSYVISERINHFFELITNPIRKIGSRS